MPNPLPEFERPPLDEMVMGVQFDPLPNFKAAHFGLFWSRIRAEYPHTDDQVPLPTALEPAEIKPVAVSVQAVQMTAPPLPRCMFLAQDKTQLIQVQPDRFWRNWRRIEESTPYPRFDHLATKFNRDWEGFCRFADDERLAPVKVNQCELTYVNNIDRGSAWTEFGELDRVFPLQRYHKAGGFLPPPEMIAWQVRYKLPGGRGRLHVEMNPSLRGRDMKLVLGLNLTARGAPADGSAQQITAWFKLAHEWVVRAFAELTGPETHKLWGLKP